MLTVLTAVPASLLTPASWAAPASPTTGPPPAASVSGHTATSNRHPTTAHLVPPVDTLRPPAVTSLRPHRDGFHNVGLERSVAHSLARALVSNFVRFSTISASGARIVLFCGCSCIGCSVCSVGARATSPLKHCYFLQFLNSSLLPLLLFPLVFCSVIFTFGLHLHCPLF